MPTPTTPLNLSILELDSNRATRLGQVSALDVFEGSSQSFHDDGLFSIKIFGNAGTKERDNKFGYINVKIDIIHPFILKTVFRLKSMYQRIVSGRAFAVWDDKEKDFVPSDPINGQTGFHFFLQHWQEIKFKPTSSKLRDQKIEMIDMFRKKALTQRVLVVPAGLRDVTIDETGRLKQSELNDLYRSLISISNAVSSTGSKDVSLMDTTRLSLQNAFSKIYDFLDMMIEGKGGMIQGKWVSRNIFFGTRNVLTPMDTRVPVLGAKNGPGINSSVIGLYQLLFAAQPFVRHFILTRWAAPVFMPNESTARLIDPVTLKSEIVKVSPETIDKWMTSAGIDKLITGYGDHDRRHKPVMVEGRYLALVYRSDTEFRIIRDISELPDEARFNKKDVHPLTYIEMFYLCGYREWNTLPIFVTRYPIAGNGSIYPSYCYPKTTISGRMMYELNETWERYGESHVAVEYPDFDRLQYMDTIAVAPARLGGLAGDHDGDMVSGNVPFTDEARKEIAARMKTVAFYLSPMGGLQSSAATVDTVDRVIFNFSGD